VSLPILEYTRGHLIEQIMVLRAPAQPCAYRRRLLRAGFMRLQKLNRLLLAQS
jgi:hypothetical protein